MDHQQLLTLAGDFGTAILLGALIGIEREKRKREDDDADYIAGLRTFTLIALLGAATAWLSKSLQAEWILPVVLLILGVLVVAGYTVTAKRRSFGLTSEIAAVVVFLLAAMVMYDQQVVAVALAVVTAAILAYKQPLHSFVDRLGWDDVYAGVRLLIATFIALPLLPNEPIDPWGALNPYKLWLLVILISSLSLVGYVLTRWLGPARGAALTGAAGGLVSSTAVTLSFAKEAREKPKKSAALACGILLAWVVMFVRVVILVGIVNRPLLTHVLVPFAVMAIVAGAFAAWLYYRNGTAGAAAAKGDVDLKNPFSLMEAAKFGAVFAVVLLAVKLVQAYFPPQGMYFVAALAGLTDVDAITLSMAEFAKSGDAAIAVIAIVIAAVSNTLVKCGLAVGLGGQAFGRNLIVATAATLLAGLAAALLL